MCKIEIPLKQHTPLIHFQHYQDGAMLRASELKPKLDKFLIRKLSLTEKKMINGKNEEVAKIEHASWFNNKEKLSLDYKVKITYDGISIKDYIEQPKLKNKNQNNGKFKTKTDKNGIESTETYTYPLFFGNLGTDYYKTETIKKFVFIPNKITLSISSFNKNILDSIEKYFSEFIALENFGSRQDKGFGSFYLDDNYDKYLPINETNFDYKFQLTSSGKDIWEKAKKLFYNLELFYRALRSGINLKDYDRNDKFYFKSLLFLYFKDKGIQWEKKTIKEEFFKDNAKKHNGSLLYQGLNTQKTNRSTSEALHFASENKKLVKDLLGLSNREKWSYYYNSITKTEAKYDAHGNKIKKDKKEDQIERFKSPIFFKIIKSNTNKYTVYIKLNEDIPIKGKWFMIENDSSKKPFPLQVPEDFSLYEFFAFIKDKTKFDITTFVESKFQKDANGNSTSEYEILKNIFDGLTKINASALI